MIRIRKSCSEAYLEDKDFAKEKNSQILLAHTHVWPLLRNLEAIAPLTAVSRSASSNTKMGACNGRIEYPRASCAGVRRSENGGAYSWWEGMDEAPEECNTRLTWLEC